MALFREHDLRGIVGEELTEPIAEQVGQGLCHHGQGARSRESVWGGMGA